MNTAKQNAHDVSDNNETFKLNIKFHFKQSWNCQFVAHFCGLQRSAIGSDCGKNGEMVSFAGAKLTNVISLSTSRCKAKKRFAFWLVSETWPLLEPFTSPGSAGSR